MARARIPIATTRCSTIAQTRIGFDVVTVITDLGSFDSAVAACLDPAQCIAAIPIDDIGVIALLGGFFIGTHNTITAARQR